MDIQAELDEVQTAINATLILWWKKVILTPLIPEKTREGIKISNFLSMICLFIAIGLSLYIYQRTYSNEGLFDSL